MSTRPYPSYKDSGVKWFASIPASWEALKLKYVATVQPSNVDKKSEDGELPVKLCNYVDVYYHDRITADMDFMLATATEAEKRKFQLRAGDVCVTKDSEEWSDIAVPACVAEDVPDLLCGYHLALVRPRVGHTHGQFLAWAFSARGVNDQFRVEANGITRFALGQDALCNALFPVPPLDEQQAIASFLDRETVKIDALVKKMERLVELLQEQRTARISHAVSKGLNPDAPMKDSGVPWLGRIPEHWEVKKGRYIGTILSYEGEPGPELRENNPVAYLKVDDLNRPGNGLYLNKPLAERYHVQDASTEAEDEIVVFPKRGAAIFTNKVRIACGAVMLDPNVMGWRVFRQNDTRYVALALWVRKLTDLADVSSVPQINNKHIYPAKFPIPPVDEQRAITAHLDRETAKLDALIAKVRTTIERLQEYRTALISAAVTGQIDVRSVSTL